MRTYIKYHQPIKEKVEETRAWLEEKSARIDPMTGIRDYSILSLWGVEDIAIEEAKGSAGCPDYFDYGHNDYKLSGAPEAEIGGVVGLLFCAIQEQGLVVNLPTDAGDYMSPAQIRLIQTAEPDYERA